VARSGGWLVQLLERESFLQTLAEYAGEARQGDGRLVLVSGDAGMGKTVLLEEFASRADGTRWLWGGCDGLLTPRPLGPVFDIAPQAGGELAELCRQDASRDQLFAAFAAALDSPAALTVAVLEDVHWADEATIDLLHFLGRRLGRMRTLLLVTYRDDELGAGHPLRVVIGDLATQRSIRRMRLPPLSAAAVAELAAAADVDSTELHKVTGGNPFYVAEIVATGWPAIPATVREIVGARLARLSPDGREAVHAAAVFGARVEPALVAAVLPDGEQLLDMCVQSGILIADGPALQFRHELVRLAVEAGISPHRKIDLHARLLAALEAAGDADPAVLAHHAAGAGDQKAVQLHAPEAARRSSALGAHREAAAHLERAVRFTGADDQAALAELHERLAHEYALLDRWPESEHALHAALALRQQSADQLSTGRVLSRLSHTQWQICKGRESAQTAEQALRILAALPPSPELAWAYVAMATVHWSEGRHDEALASIAKAEDLGRQLGETALLCTALTWRGMTQIDAGQDGIPSMQQGLDAALKAGLPEQTGSVYVNLQDGCNSLQQFADAERYYTAGMAFCDKRDLRALTRCLRGSQADTLLALGRWDEAAELCTQLLAIPGVSPANQLYPLRDLAAILGRRGDADAWAIQDRALALAVQMAEPAWIAQARAIQAEMLWLSGQADDAAAEADAACAEASGRVDPWRLGSLAIWLWRLRPASGLPPGLPEPYALEVAGDFAGAAAAWQRLGRPYDAALVWLHSEDEAGLRAALQTFDDLGARAVAAVGRRRMRQLGLTSIPRGPRATTRTTPAGLTAREQQVLALVAEGLPDRAISQRLFISERTVHHHVSAILGKIGVQSRSAAGREAARLGIRL
jgi:DNA-binding CsgD family transcriptional regulator/tetratricopeptide (TPR) repeat protein